MTIPSTAVALAEIMDPKDIRDYILDLSGLLESGEQFATIGIAVYPESVALGFEVRTTAPYAPFEVSDSEVRIWCSVVDGNQSDAGFDGSGRVCGIEVTATTDSSPARRFQRSVTVKVAQR